MEKKHISIALVLILAAFFCSNAIDGKSINGRAVSVQWLYSQTSWGSTFCHSSGEWCGSIDLFTISGGKVTRTDTLFSRSKGYCYSPVFNICGNKIAFYRFAKAPGSGSSCTSVNGGKNTISIMDISGNNVANLCDVGTEPLMYNDGAGGLDWPAGDWIYYLKRNGSTNNQIWKVNVTNNQNVQVCTMTLEGQSFGSAYFRRFSLDLAADRIGAQIIGGVSGNDVCTFPNGCSFCSSSGNCNAAISASGNYKASFEGDHSRLILSVFPGVSGITVPTENADAYKIDTKFQPTTTDKFGADVEGLGWACNSDKWVLQHVGWYGHADMLSWGSEQVATNWVDFAAIRISNNGKTTQETCPAEGRPGADCCGGCGKIFPGNEQGDLWVDGGASNMGKYEDASGVWHSVPGWTGTCPPTSVADMPAVKDAPRMLSASVDNKGSIRIFSQVPCRGILRIADMQGHVVYSAALSGPMTVLAKTLKPGVYLVRGESGKSAVSTRITVSY
jgi:hypothetical protein